MRIFLIIVVLLISAIFSDILIAQDKDIWDKFAKVRIVDRMYMGSGEKSGIIKHPYYTEDIKKLEGKTVDITGFLLPVSLTKSIVVLSRTPSSMCFFCGAGGMETIVEVIPKDKDSKLNTLKLDQYIKIKGKLKLNKDDDPGHLIFILEHAELVEILDK